MLKKEVGTCAHVCVCVKYVFAICPVREGANLI